MLISRGRVNISHIVLARVHTIVNVTWIYLRRISIKIETQYGGNIACRLSRLNVNFVPCAGISGASRRIPRLVYSI